MKRGRRTIEERRANKIHMYPKRVIKRVQQLTGQRQSQELRQSQLNFQRIKSPIQQTKNSTMEDAAFRARLQRLDRDASYFQHLLQEAPQRERLEIRRQLLAVLQEKKATIQRQKEHTINQIAQKDLENARMARAIEALERMRNVQN